MSIVNQRTGRHEDDILQHAHEQGGVVTVQELLEHIEECIIDVPSAYGSATCDILDALTFWVRARAVEDNIDLNERVPLR